MTLDRPEQIASDAVARLLDAQMPWGEWGAIGESPEVRNAQRMRPEYRYSPIPKANVFRTILALDCLEKAERCDAVDSAIQRASGWLRDRLWEGTHPQAPNGGVWTAHVAIPAGIGLGFDTPDLVCIIDLRHTSQAWSSLLWQDVVEADAQKQLEQAVDLIVDAADTDGLWGNIQGSERPNNFASACCVSFLRSALDDLQGHRRPKVNTVLGQACLSLPGRLEEALRPQIKPQAAEEAGRSLWILARSGLQEYFQSLRSSLERRLRALIGEGTLDSLRAGIRLTAAARAFGWAVEDHWIVEGYKKYCDALHPPDLAFVVLALDSPVVSGIEELRRAEDRRVRRRLLLQVALQERLEVFEWLEIANRELTAERIKQEQFSYICALVGEDDLSYWSFLKDEISYRNWVVVQSEIEKLEVFRRRLLSGKISPGEDMAGANREIMAALQGITRKEIQAFLGRVLYACYRVREYHRKKRFPRDLLQHEEHVQHLLALELDALGFHASGFETVLSSGRIDFLIKEPGSTLEMIAECKFVRKREELDSQRQTALRDADDWVKQRQETLKKAETGVDQVAQYPGSCCRIVFICCLFEEEYEKTLADYSFHSEVRRQGDFELLIVWMYLYFWIEAASRSARN